MHDYQIIHGGVQFLLVYPSFSTCREEQQGIYERIEASSVSERPRQGAGIFLTLTEEKTGLFAAIVVWKKKGLAPGLRTMKRLDLF